MDIWFIGVKLQLFTLCAKQTFTVYLPPRLLVRKFCCIFRYLEKFLSKVVFIFSQALLTEFSESFPNYSSMLAILSEFSTPISLGEFTSPLNWDPQQQAERVQMVVWFLKRFMLFQLRTYVYLCINEGDSKLNVIENLKPTKIASDEEQFRSAIEKNVKNKSDVDAILRLPASENRDDLRIFIKLLRYFNGDYHLEDIMYRENLRRHELLRILTKFNDILVVCTHEDELSSVFIEKFE